MSDRDAGALMGFTYIISLERRIEELRRSLDNIKIRAYETGNKEIHDNALEALKGDEYRKKNVLEKEQ